jgi:hypothetical protein
MTSPTQRRTASGLRLFLTPLVLVSLARAPVFGNDDKQIVALAARIDQRLAAAWGADVKPAPLADDAEFFRRLHLDLAGRIPSIVEIRDFLDDTRPDKRRLWTERILQSNHDDPAYRDTYSHHFATVWRAWLLPQAGQQLLSRPIELEVWLRQRLRSNVGYDQIVRDLLTLDPISGNLDGSPYDGSPAAFYQANDLQPENLAASTARLFLGIKLECAQCHAHPFAKWTREQFWEYAAFFADVPRAARPGGAGKLDPREGIKIMGTDKVAKARFLNGAAPHWTNARTRPTLAAWMTASDNPYFARAVVNRLWSYFFGAGLVEQLDSPPEDQNAAHSALLEELARAFVASKYDLKFLIRVLVATQAYQRTSTVSPSIQPDQKLFVRMPLRGLSPEQLFDSLAVATERSENAVEQDQFVLGEPASPRAQFAAKFPNQEQKNDYQTSILQALYLMNNEFIARQTSVRKNPTLTTLAEQQTSNASKVESLYLVVLSRKPRPQESKRFADYIDTGDPNANLADVFWILLNSPEFILNH